MKACFTTNGVAVYDKWYRLNTTNSADKKRQMVQINATNGVGYKSIYDKWYR